MPGMNVRLCLPSAAAACGFLLSACGSVNFRESQAPDGSNRDEASLSPLARRINAETLAVVPAGPKPNALFDVYGENGDAAWGRNWTHKVNLGGVSWDGTRTVTLVSPLHVVMAAHYVRKPGDLVVFRDAKGKRVPRTLKALLPITLPNGIAPDIAVGLLDRSVPLKFYKVPPADPSFAAQLPGSYVLVTDGERRLHCHEVASAEGWAIQFGYSEKIHKAYWEDLIVGDSSNPSFILLHGEPVLVETHTTGGAGAGPYYGDPEVVAAINQRMTELGGGYQLTHASP